MEQTSGALRSASNFGASPAAVPPKAVHHMRSASKITCGVLLLVLLLNGACMTQATERASLQMRAMPWLLPADHPKLAYEGQHNDLNKLVRAQQKNKWISVFPYNKAVTRYLLNAIYSFVRFGEARNYIVAASDAASLQACLSYRLPCLNASYILGDMGVQLSDKELSMNSKEYLKMVWGKIMVLSQVIKLGYHVHFSDVDVVYLRPIYQSYKPLFYRFQVDAVFMKETIQEVVKLGIDGMDPPASSIKKPNMFNTGVYVMRATNNSRKLVDKWLAANDWTLHDQAVLNQLAFKDYIVCSAPAACTAAKAEGWPTVYRHPSQFGRLGVCPSREPDQWRNPCDPVRLFVHGICHFGWGFGPEEKGMLYQKYNLWVVDEDGQPMWTDPEIVNISRTSHEFLPCPGTAWGPEMLIGAESLPVGGQADME